MSDDASVIKQLATTDTENKIYGIKRSLTLFAFFFYHVMIVIDFVLQTPEHRHFEAGEYSTGVLALIGAYAVSDFITNGIPRMAAFQQDGPPCPPPAMDKPT